MGMTTIQGHLFPGILISVVAVLILLRELAVLKGAWIRYVLPAAFIASGVQAIFDKVLHGAAAPEDYGAETAQHMMQGAIVLAAGIVELLRERGALKHRAFALLTPAALVLVGVMFLMHAQQGSGAPMLVMLVQHRAYGVTLIMAAAARAFAELAPARAGGFKVAFPTLMLLFGVLFMIYAEAEGGGHGGMQMSH